jgi:hypothetical protein
MHVALQSHLEGVRLPGCQAAQCTTHCKHADNGYHSDCVPFLAQQMLQCICCNASASHTSKTAAFSSSRSTGKNSTRPAHKENMHKHKRQLFRPIGGVWTLWTGFGVRCYAAAVSMLPTQHQVQLLAVLLDLRSVSRMQIYTAQLRRVPCVLVLIYNFACSSTDLTSHQQ